MVRPRSTRSISPLETGPSSEAAGLGDGPALGDELALEPSAEAAELGDGPGLGGAT